MNATLSGLGRMDLANYIQTGGQIVMVTISAFLLYSGWGVKSLFIGNMLSYLFIHIVSLVCIHRIIQIHLLQIENFDISRCKRLLNFGGGIFGGSLASMLISPFNKLMLSRYVGVSSIPVYEISFKLSMSYSQNHISRTPPKGSLLKLF